MSLFECSRPFAASKLEPSVRCIEAPAVRRSRLATCLWLADLPNPVRQCSRTSAAFWVGVLRAGPSSEARPTLQAQPRRPGSSLARAWPELGPTRSPSPSQHAARVEAAAAASLGISQQCNCARVLSLPRKGLDVQWPLSCSRPQGLKLKAFLTELQVRPERSRSPPQLPLSLSPESPLAPLGPSHRVAARLGALVHIRRVSAQPRV